MKYLHERMIKHKLIILVIVLQILFFIVCMTVILKQLIFHSGCKENEYRTEYYKSVRICAGESLWEISNRYYSEEYQSLHLYIQKIMKLNNLFDENICSGDYLIIPYYD